MSEIETLVSKYERQVRLPWVRILPPPQRVWFLIYDKTEERRVRPRLGAFAAATHTAGHGWSLVDLTNTFAEWMAGHEYREAYFQQPPEAMQMALADFSDHVVDCLGTALTAPDVDGQTMVAVVGAASLFGLIRTSDVLPRVEDLIRGRLLIFFPGRYDSDDSSYRLLDARDGWNYHAVRISAAAGD